METREIIDQFFTSGKIAVIGASENKTKFGYQAVKELKKRGFSIFPVNPRREFIEGEKCYSSVKTLPPGIEDAVFIIPPGESKKVVREVPSSGIRRVWFQTGSESDDAVNFCCQNNIEVIYKKCVLMYAPPVEGFHKFHRTIWKLIGKL